MHPKRAFTIASTWNGKSLPQPEHIRLELELRPKGLLLDFDAPFYDDPPPAAEPGPVWELWEHEVVELFVAHGDQYTEIELGPRGHYLALRLEGVRNIVSHLHEIRYRVYPSPGRWQGTALVPLDLLPPQPWTFNACAIHGLDASRRYSALFAAPGDAPDFHQLGVFQPLEFS